MTVASFYVELLFVLLLTTDAFQYALFGLSGGTALVVG